VIRTAWQESTVFLLMRWDKHPDFVTQRLVFRKRACPFAQGLSSRGEKVSLPLKEHRKFLSK